MERNTVYWLPEGCSSIDAAFRQKLEELERPTPWRLDDEAAGVVLDAAGDEVLTVDSQRSLTDSQAMQIASWIVCAVNTLAGFRAQREVSRGGAESAEGGPC